jgi:transposase-like protein
VVPPGVGHVGLVEDVPDPQVPAQAKRRTFTREYKRRIVRLYEAASAAERAALMRREGLYSSRINEWRRQFEADAERGAVRRGRPAKDPKDATIARLQKEIAKLRAERDRALTVIDVQKNIVTGLVGVTGLVLKDHHVGGEHVSTTELLEYVAPFHSLRGGAYPKRHDPPADARLHRRAHGRGRHHGLGLRSATARRETLRPEGDRLPLGAAADVAPRSRTRGHRPARGR